LSVGCYAVIGDVAPELRRKSTKLQYITYVVIK
jgi:hypothetical protein